MNHVASRSRMDVCQSVIIFSLTNTPSCTPPPLCGYTPNPTKRSQKMKTPRYNTHYLHKHISWSRWLTRVRSSLHTLIHLLGGWFRALLFRPRGQGPRDPCRRQEDVHPPSPIPKIDAWSVCRQSVGVDPPTRARGANIRRFVADSFFFSSEDR